MKISYIRRLTQLLFLCFILLMPVFNILRYDVDTKELFLFGKVWSSGFQQELLLISIYILISSIFVRHVLCKYVCAAGLMQILFGWISPFSLRLIFLKEDARRCTDCKRCEEVCFMNVKPRKNNRDISCVNCGLCIEACNKELADVDSPKGLFKLRFGSLVAK